MKSHWTLSDNRALRLQRLKHRSAAGVRTRLSPAYRRLVSPAVTRYACGARRILRRLEFHYTPKHGSCLNLAERESSIFSRQCCDRPTAGVGALQRETQVLEDPRNIVFPAARPPGLERAAQILACHAANTSLARRSPSA